jgi:hypothetical protein
MGHNSQKLNSALSAVMQAALLVSLWSCGGAENDGSDDAVGETLDGLGIDTTLTDRVDDQQQPLPGDYSPFGSARTFERIDELVILGLPLAPSFGSNSQMTLVEEVPNILDDNGKQLYDTSILFNPDPADTPWAVSVGDAPSALRTAARADFDDRDGLEEFAAVYQLDGETAVQVQVYDDKQAGFAAIQTLTVATASPNEIVADTGDFNGDGYSEMVIGLSFPDSGQLVFLESVEGELQLAGASRALPQAFDGSELHLAMAVGNLDYDSPQELAVVVNEAYTQPSDTGLLLGTSRYFVFDDAGSDYTKVADALVQGGSAAVLADVSIGDIDGDNLGELLFAGLDSFNPIVDCDYQYLLLARDDLAHGRELLGMAMQDSGLASYCGSGAPPLQLRQMHINALDLDRDGLPEVQVNQFLFEDWRNSAPWTPIAGAEIPVESLFLDTDGALTGSHDRHHSAVAVGDVTADKREDVTLYSQTNNRVEIWGLSEPAEQWGMLASIAMDDSAAQQTSRPVLLPVNVDHDSFALQYDGSHELVFTEPVIIAALAAAPCADNLGQDDDACRTSYGTGTSTGVEAEHAFSVTASVSVGFKAGVKIPVIDVGGEVETLASVRTSAEFSTATSYELTKTVVYTSGPLEDTVIFTSIPYDLFTYTVKSHPDPTQIGKQVVVSLPRSPVELHVERSFYNANVAQHGGFMVDERVFGHTAGQPHSYPSAARKDALLDEFAGVEAGPVAVGGGAGEAGLEIQVVKESSLGQSYGVEAELEVQATAGWAIGGFSIGGGYGFTLQHSHGTELTYGGGVGHMPADKLAEHGYRWGLFTYVRDQGDGEQQFEVINYWVE